MPGQFRPRGVMMRDCSKNRAGFDRVLMAVAATFLTVSATSALAQSDPLRNSAAELAIDAAVPRPEPANVPPPTAGDFKLDASASVPDAAKTDSKASEVKASEKPAAKPADVVTAPAADAPKSDTAATTTTSPPAAATATPAAEPTKAASNVPPADQPVADKLRDLLGGKSLRYFDRKAERSAVEKFYTAREFSPYILLLWACIRWIIATLTSIAVIALIYHNAVPRTQPWHSVIPGATLATGLWFSSTLLFGWYLQHYADYSLIYGSLGAAIALLVWMYMISLVVLVGAEFNAMLFPRAMLGKELIAISSPNSPH